MFSWQAATVAYTCVVYPAELLLEVAYKVLPLVVVEACLGSAKQVKEQVSYNGL